MIDFSTYGEYEYVAQTAFYVCGPDELINSDASPEIVRNALDRFKTRRTNLEESLADEKQSYYTEPIIIKKVEAFNLDKDKFWLLLAFTHALVNSSFQEHIFKSCRDHAQNALRVLTPHSAIIIKGEKRNYEIKNEDFNNIFSELLSAIASSRDLSMNTGRYSSKLNKDLTIPKLKMFKDILHTFLSIHSPAKRPSKKSFIANLAYIMSFTDKQHYLTGEVLLPIKTKANEALARRRATRELNGKRFIVETLDVGKIIEDDTKKCKIAPTPSWSSYWSDPTIMDP